MTSTMAAEEGNLVEADLQNLYVAATGTWDCTFCATKCSRRFNLKRHFRNSHNLNVDGTTYTGNPQSHGAVESTGKQGHNTIDETFYQYPHTNSQESTESMQQNLPIDETTYQDPHTNSQESTESMQQNLPNYSLEDMEVSDEDDPPLHVHVPLSNTPLYAGAPLNLKEHELCVAAYASRHKLSGLAVADMKKLINLHIPKPNLVGFHHKSDDTILREHAYCPICGAHFQMASNSCPTENCDGSRENQDIFYSTLPDEQLRDIIQRDENWKGIGKTKQMLKTPVTSLTDVTDGERYRRECIPGGFFDPNGHNLSLLGNTDGVPLFKSSKVSIWPVFLVVNELPINLRFLKKNMVLWGLWQGRGKPKMQSFLQPFISDMLRLHFTGITLTIGPIRLTVFFKLVLFTMDLQARADVLYMTAHNGEFPCIFCLAPGIRIPSGKGTVRAYQHGTAEERSQETIVRDCEIASWLINDKAHNGLFGYSVLNGLPDVDLTSMICVDYMHGELLGVQLKLLSLWLTKKEEGYYIGDKIDQIETRLLSIKPPHYMKRLPRKLEGHGQNWKAAELRSWLLVYSIPVLRGILPERYIQHFAAFVEAIWIMLQSRIEFSALQRAEELLEDFCSSYENFYGLQSCGLNFHNLRHLSQCVKNWGPLWAYSCFPFESRNGDLLKMAHGTGSIAKQVFNGISVEQKTDTTIKTTEDGDIKDLLVGWSFGASKRIPHGILAENCQYVLPEQECLGENLRFVCRQLNRQEMTAVFTKLFRVILFNKFIFHSKEYTKPKKRISYWALLKDGCVGEILYFVRDILSNQVYAVIHKCNTEPYLLSRRCSHISRLLQPAVKCVINVSDIVQPVVYVLGLYGGSVTCLPNFYEYE